MPRPFDVSSAGARFAAGLGLALALAGCDSETGKGHTFGSLFVRSCVGDRPYATISDEQPSEYNLAPRFIAGEPLEDPRRPARMNRLLLRIQSSGKRVESDDVLTFDFVDSQEVARCLWGGRKPDGRADYDEALCVPITRERDGARLAGAVILVGPETPLRAYFTPRATCPNTLTGAPRNYVATAVAAWPADAPAPPGPNGRRPSPARPPEAPPGWASWIEIVAFGDAESCRDKPETDKCMAQRRSFRVEFDERIEATGFDLLMMDDRYVKRLKRGEPPGTPEIMARLAGEFVLKLERGQGAQTFP